MRADIYARKSTEDAGRSVLRQDQECRDAIAANGWDVGRFFADDGLSASRFARKARAEYEALIEHIAAGDCQVLVLWESSRGARREVIWFQLLELCRDRGVQIHIVTHERTYTLTNRRDWRTLADEGVDSADESAKISERSQSGKRKIAMAGKPAGRLLYGYAREYDPHTRAYLRQVENQPQAAVVRRMAAGIKAGRSCASIARELNSEGVPTAMGKTWRPRDISRLIQNPAYVRRRVHQGQVLPDVEAEWPALLTEETWLACCRILGDPRRLTNDGRSDMKWFLTRVMRCGRDGCNGVLGNHKGAGARRYACLECWRLTIAAAPMDEFITGVVKRRLARADAKDLFLPRVDSAAASAADGELRKLRDELAEWRELAKQRKVTPASFAEIEAGLLPQLDQAEVRARRLAAPTPLPELAGVDVGARWDKLPPRTQREVVRLLMSITVVPSSVRGGPFDPDRVHIEWR